MRPLNHEERNKLFGQFLLLSVITLLVLVFALHFDFELPQQLSELQRKRYEESRSFFKNQKQIVKQMDVIETNIKMIETSNSPLVAQAQVTDAITQLRKLGNSGSDTSNNVFVIRLADAYAKYSDAKVASRNNSTGCSEKEKQISDLKMELNTEKQRALTYQTQITSLQSQLSQAGFR